MAKTKLQFNLEGSVPIILRKDFSRIKRVINTPNLLEVQRKSYERFLQKDIPQDKRANNGLQGVFKSVFPIEGLSKNFSLEFMGYTIGEPKYSIFECKQKGLTYSASLKVLFDLVTFELDSYLDGKNVQREIKDIKEQEVYFGEIPLMTQNGSFIINGIERVIVSQLQRSPGVFYDNDKIRSHTQGRPFYTARVIPYRGSWLDFEFDQRDMIFARIDRKRKFPATILLKAVGYSRDDILGSFYQYEVFKLINGKYFRRMPKDFLTQTRASEDIINPKTKEVLIKKNRRITKLLIDKLEEAGVEFLPCDESEVIGKYLTKDVAKDGEIIAKSLQPVTSNLLETFKNLGINEFSVYFIDNINVSSSILDTILADKINSKDDAVIDIYKRMRPGDPPNLISATSYFENMFFNPERYDLSEVGRLKINNKLNLNKSLDDRVLFPDDILNVLKYLMELKDGRGIIDDIDHLGNRRVKAVGELLENQFRIGLVRMERAIKERMTTQKLDSLMPNDLINPKPVNSLIKEFFGRSQLSQFMDQTNPLSEITHKRRLSALGPGGLTRERAGFEVRDVHPTHYGRICPIETPEGPNIGLIASLSSYARVNEYGFIETPYRKVKVAEKGAMVTDDVDFLTAMEEEKYVIAQANAEIDKNGYLVNELIPVRRSGETVMVYPNEVDYIDVSPMQLVSVATSLIPFLEHDDANRALMGSNMQRQGVPLLMPDPPIIGTGIEKIVAKDSGVCVVAEHNGIVSYVDSTKIYISRDGEGALGKEDNDPVSIYNLVKFQRSNQNTCLNQRPLVKAGDRVIAGQIIADGASTKDGELALGHNVLVSFMPWNGYNFEDSILISEKLLHEDAFTSIHIEEFEVACRETKSGKEEITSDIPNVGEDALRNLDENGIIRIGAEVKAQDILAGKVTPKGETVLTPEEKLLRAIFGEKAKEVKDTSLRVPPGVSGVVVDVRVFSRKGIEKDFRAKEIEDSEVANLIAELDDKILSISDNALGKMRGVVQNRKCGSNAALSSGHKPVYLKKGDILRENIVSKLTRDDIFNIEFEGNAKNIYDKLKKIDDESLEDIDLLKGFYEDKITRMQRGDELPPGVLKTIKVYIAIKRRLSVGDKMAGRHGNKGVVSRILPLNDMPFMKDGRIVDMVLNPLGVPSRMNVGQILEVHLGWAAHNLGIQINKIIEENFGPEKVREKLLAIFNDPTMVQFIKGLNGDEVIELAKKYKNGVYMATPIFDGAKESEIRNYLKLSGVEETGQVTLYDGRSGEPFDRKVTVGIMYMLKLHHLVDDKIHARSTGPYSLVTQQPLGGKAQFGGQRLGEMEVWAMEAYGAAHTLQEFLTVKSDDSVGRTRMYEAIVKGHTSFKVGLPESFNVLIKELQSLCLNVELLKEGENVN
ncbi:MAG: DNA-directed RNA polymerase subunit beta [Deltaproteobacteria bacterium]|nr:DNA-directed RNA polymerase subunit beta [Deltaproteobacteria bacterium]